MTSKYEIVNGSLRISTDGKAARDFRPLDRDVIAILPLPASSDCIVLSDYRSHEPGPFANVARIDASGREIWRATPPGARNDEFTSIRLVDGLIHAYASSGYSVVLKPRNGKVVETLFVK